MVFYQSFAGFGIHLRFVAYYVTPNNPLLKLMMEGVSYGKSKE